MQFVFVHYFLQPLNALIKLEYSSIWISHLPNCPEPPYQSEARCTSFHLVLFACEWKLISIWKVVHLAWIGRLKAIREWPVVKRRKWLLNQPLQFVVVLSLFCCCWVRSDKTNIYCIIQTLQKRGNIFLREIKSRENACFTGYLQRHSPPRRCILI